MKIPLIAHIVYSFRVGGLENGMVNLINRLPVERYRHAIISLTDVDTAFCRRIQRKDVAYVELNKAPGHGIKLFPRVYRVLRQMRPAVVHTRNLAALEMSLPAWAARVPVRVHGEHGRDVDDPDGSNRTYQRVRRAYKPFVSHYIALSRDLDAYLGERIAVAPGKRSLICNGVDASRFSPTADGRHMAVADSPFNDPSLYVFGTVGRMQAVKNHVGLVRAFAHMRRSGGAAAQRARLMIVGDGPLHGEVAAIAREEDVSDYLWLAGERTDVSEVMRAMDCFVLPSLAEGISNTVLEAMACGLPVIASAVGGNIELVHDGVNGSLVPASHVLDLADAMLRYVLDANHGRVQGSAARARIEAEFSLDGMVRRYDELYQKLMARASAII
ncbi:MAG TPA: TIGR03088 family PEP-CTERM/XrtA system glycosyltransferase [Rhodocyclaceae bacterium]|nr:TIGR03088 family PEP-CTERM/XrtA system glycosyltransferase [Rhodocyclaceae bacterium]